MPHWSLVQHVKVLQNFLCIRKELFKNSPGTGCIFKLVLDAEDSWRRTKSLSIAVRSQPGHGDGDRGRRQGGQRAAVPLCFLPCSGCHRPGEQRAAKGSGPGGFVLLAEAFPLGEAGRFPCSDADRGAAVPREAEDAEEAEGEEAEQAAAAAADAAAARAAAAGREPPSEQSGHGVPGPGRRQREPPGPGERGDPGELPRERHCLPALAPAGNEPLNTAVPR